MRLYLDACCLNRPFDDQNQLRVRLETEAIRTILRLCQEDVHDWLSSDVLQAELEQTPNLDRQQLTLDLLALASEQVAVTKADYARAAEFSKNGVSGFDAVHLAIAERTRCDLFLTTDDRLSRRSERPLTPSLNVRVTNPLVWIQEQHT